MNTRLQPPALAAALLFAALHIVGCDAGGGASTIACATPQGGSTVPLVSHDLWQVAPADGDPWVAARPAEDGCTDANRYAEDFSGTYSYAIQTGPECGYTTVVQPALTSACKGQRLFVWVWRFGLTAPDPGEAHIGVRIGDFDAWEVTVPIPSDSALYTPDIVLPVDVPAGTPIFYHVDNHGSNSYNLLEISIKGD